MNRSGLNLSGRTSQTGAGSGRTKGLATLHAHGEGNPLDGRTLQGSARLSEQDGEPWQRLLWEHQVWLRGDGRPRSVDRCPRRLPETPAPVTRNEPAFYSLIHLLMNSFSL
jgi:hypothetical protein